MPRLLLAGPPGLLAMAFRPAAARAVGLQPVDRIVASGRQPRLAGGDFEPTEVGIQVVTEDIRLMPPASFLGKLLAMAVGLVVSVRTWRSSLLLFST